MTSFELLLKTVFNYFNQMSFNKELCERIRSHVITIAKESVDRFHPADLEMIKENDWWIERFVLAAKTEDTAQKMLIKALEWRKSFGVNELTEDYFPWELYKIGLYTTNFEDKEGRPILWVKINAYHKSELTPFIKKFMVYNIEKMNRQTSHQGYGAIVDYTGVSLSDVDLDYMKFLINVNENYYPFSEKYSLHVNLPWILNATAKLVMAFMNEDSKNIIKFLKKAELSQYVDPEQIPVHLDGLYDKNMAVIPEGVKPLEQLTHTHYSAEQIKKIRSAFKKELK